MNPDAFLKLRSTILLSAAKVLQVKNNLKDYTGGFTFLKLLWYDLQKGGGSMNISISLKESIYDCKIIITDSKGSRNYDISALCDDEKTIPPIAVEVFDPEFDLTLIPIMPDVSPALNELEENSWKDKLAKKASKL